MGLDVRTISGWAALGGLVLLTACAGPPADAGATATPAPPQQPSSVIAKVGEKSITLETLDQEAIRSNMATYQQLYQARRGALEVMIGEELLRQEAATRGISEEELVEEAITSKFEPVTDEEIQAYYDANQARMRQLTFEQVEDQLREGLNGQKESLARQTFLDELKQKTTVELSLDPPRVPLTVASGERMKGPADADVTIVEYSDFQ